MASPDNILDFFEAVNQRNLAKMGGLLHPEAVFYFPKTRPLLGRDRIVQFFNVLFRQYPELSFDVQRVIRQSNQVAVHWVNRGVNRKQEPYRNEGVTILETEGGSIQFMSDFFKDTEQF